MTRRHTAGAVAVVVVAAPVAIGVAYSTMAALGLAGVGATGFTLDRVTAVLTSPTTWRGLAWTFLTAGVATLLSLALAFIIAVRLRGSRVGQAVSMLPMAVPHVAAALAALLMLGQSGLLSRLAHGLSLTSAPADFPAMVYDRYGVSLVLTFIWKELPYLALTAIAVLLTGTRELEEAARTLGATARQVFRHVTWPQLWRGTAPAALAAFAFLVGQYEMPALLAPSDPTALSVLIYERASDPDLSRRGEAHVLGLLALGSAGALAFLHAARRGSAAYEARE